MQSNRFKAFSDSEEISDEENTQKQDKVVDNRPRAEKRKGNKKAEETIPVETQHHDASTKKQKSAREGQKQKGVSAEPHPQDKHSGMGLRTHDRKGGAGKGNWGTYKDEVKDVQNEYVPKDQQIEEKEGEQQQEQQQQQQQEEEQYTLEEYFAKFGVNKTATQVKQTKGDQDYTDFLKEGCQIIEKQTEVDDKNPTKKKKANDKYIGMQNTDLLGFRTGLKTFSVSEKKERQPREAREAKEAKEPREQQQEAKLEEGQEGQQKEQQGEEVEKKPVRQYNGKGQGQGQKRGPYKGDRKGGNNRQGAQKTSAGVNFEDDSLFPKLG